MGITKIQLYSIDCNEVALVTKILAHPARVAILEHISLNKNCSCNDLIDVIGLSQPTISQHLEVIKKSGILYKNIKGNTIKYSINKSKFSEFELILEIYFKKLRNGFDSFES